MFFWEETKLCSSTVRPMDFARSVATGASASRITWSKLSCNFGRRSSVVAILSLQGLHGLQGLVER